MRDWVLSIDFGTSNTAAAWAPVGGTPTTVKLSPNADQLPSCVLADPAGMKVGEAARNSRAVKPWLFVGSPKKDLGDRPRLLGDVEVPGTELVGRVFMHVVDVAKRVAGGTPPTEVILTHPAAWKGGKLVALREAWAHAGVPVEPRLVSEPIAAVSRLARASEAPEGAMLAVVDYGGGTCDVAVLRVTGEPERPYRVVASRGKDDLGGIRIDEILQAWARDQLAVSHPDLAAALQGDTQAQHTLRDQVRAAKEALSHYQDADIGVLGTTVTVTLAQFEALTAGEIARVRGLVESTLRDAGVGAHELHDVFLTSGSSWIRAVRSELTDLLGREPRGLEDPKLVVALGAHNAPRVGTPPSRQCDLLVTGEARFLLTKGKVGYRVEEVDLFVRDLLAARTSEAQLWLDRLDSVRFSQVRSDGYSVTDVDEFLDSALVQVLDALPDGDQLTSDDDEEQDVDPLPPPPPSAVLEKWLVAPGQKVAQGQPVYEARTAGGLARQGAARSGVVRRLLAQPGDVVVPWQPPLEITEVQANEGLAVTLKVLASIAVVIVGLLIAVSFSMGGVTWVVLVLAVPALLREIWKKPAT